MSNPFFSDVPARPHLVRPGGLKGEVFDLRRELATAFDAVAANGGGVIAWSPAGNGDAVTWQDVKTILEAKKAPMAIYLIDTSQTYEVDESVDLHFSFFNCAPGGNILLNIQDGVQLLNGGILVLSQGLFNGGMTVVFNSTGGSPNPLAWDSQDDPGRFAAFGFGGGCDVRNDGTVPVIHVQTNPDGLLIVILMNTARVLPSTGFLVEIEDGATVFLAVVNNGVGNVDAGWISAPSDPTTCLIGVLSNDSWDFADMAGWAGVVGITIVNQPITMGGGSGPTSLRPIGALEPLIPGTRYWDVDLVPPRPIFWDGAMFVDALGIGPV
jgi:hypothetical protein